MAALSPVPLARCRLQGADDTGLGNVRYVPLVELELWMSFMASRHGRLVTVEAVSVWVAEDPATWNSGFEPPDALEPVLRVRIEKPGPHGVPIPVERFFPAESYPIAQERLLAHMNLGEAPCTIVATPGYFVPEPARRERGQPYSHH